MKKKIIQQTCLVLTLGFALLSPSLAHAGGNVGQKIATFMPMKSDADVNQLQPGDIIVKVCRDCGAVEFVRVEKPGKGIYDYTTKKCDMCGSQNTYLGVTKEVIPLKDQIKP